MSLPFRIGDVVEIDEEKILTDPTLVHFVGRRCVVKTMGISWVKVAFDGNPGNFIISSDKLKKVEDEDTHRF
jgi:hypothetical protein|tara:strand:+ start:63 stop:278 length:216 start_codon:yes stop_codon:yes gene_type:complete